MADIESGIQEDTGYEIITTFPLPEHEIEGRRIMPNLIGMTSEDAQAALVADALVVGNIFLTTGIVTSQSILGGNWVNDGTSIDFTLTS